MTTLTDLVDRVPLDGRMHPAALETARQASGGLPEEVAEKRAAYTAFVQQVGGPRIDLHKVVDRWRAQPIREIGRGDPPQDLAGGCWL